ncbi:hypothetical protein [Streptomyces sp. PsTaAH-124]|uniref:hypothetical protein n=1 Tax=Streptomyces sp. PsTaAH-124 TaxID=1157638 RepID=UPI00037F2E96|nr:hypothetical protein [Streptomyces sp. PsTaAH-124]
MTTESTSARTRKASTKVEAKQAEAENAPVSFEFKEITFSLPTDPHQLPLELLMTDDEVVATRLVLGDDQWAKFMNTKPSIADFSDLVDAMSEARGRDADAGN